MTPAASVDDDPQRNANTRTRPIRVAFLVELSEGSQPILTAIFQACFRFWGGRFSLIVPCENGTPRDAFRSWLKVYDPDIIYSYVDLSEDEQFRLHEDIYPAYLVRHREPPDGERADPRNWAPSLPITPLGIATLLPLLARRSAFGPPSPLGLATALGKLEAAPFLIDNFGMHDLAVERRATNELVGQVEIFAVNGEDVRPEHNRHVKGWLSDERELLTRLGSRQNLTTFAQLSATLTPRPDIRQFRWSESFNLVIGDTVADRMLYWNSRSFYAVWRDGSPVDLRVPYTMLADQDFRAALLAYLRGIPSVSSDNGGGGMYVTLRSASLSASELEAVQAQLMQPKQWIGWRTEVVASPDGYVPDKIEDVGWEYGISQVSGLSTGRWNPQFVTAGRWHLTAEAPEHLRHAPVTFQSESEGLWAVDLDVERGADNSPYDNVRDRWRWPRRLRVTGSFLRGYRLSNPHSPGLVPRVSRHGLLTLFTGGGSTLPTINEPTDHDAVVSALAQGRDWLPFERYDAPRPEQICYAAERSDAGRYFWGVYQLLGGLEPARGFLMSMFWRAQLAKFGATDQRPEQRIEGLKSKLRKTLPKQPFDLSADTDLNRLANVVLQEADAIRLSDKSIRWDELRADHAKFVDANWEASPGDPKDRDEAIAWDRGSLARAVQSLCERGVLHQGREFACPRCHNRSWIGIDDLKSVVACEVCKFNEAAPVDGCWDFRLNGFLKEALRRHGVGPLFWALGKLRPVTTTAYWFEGPLGIYLTKETWEKGERDTDIDLTIVAGGQVRMCEVKQSARAFDDPEGYAATFLRLRPDIATIAIMEPVSSKIRGAFAKFEAALAGSGVAAELLTFDPDQDIDDRSYLAELRRVRIF